MTKRGKILRDTAAGPGLLTVDGQQHSFTLEGMWLSDTAPRVGMTADVTFDGDRVESVRAVPENQIAKEQAGQALRQGSDMAARIKEKFGLPALIAFAVLIIGWFSLSSIDVGHEALGVQLSFWQLLHAVGSGNPIQNLGAAALGSSSMGIYGLLALVCLVGPFLSFFWPDRRAALGGLLPLLMMILTAALLALAVHRASEAAGAMFAGLGSGVEVQKMMENARAEIMSQFQVGIGAYVSFAACLYFAFTAVKKYLVATA